MPVLVGDHDDGLVHLLIDLAEQVEHQPGVLRIEVRTRLIGKQDVGLVHHRPGDRDPLLLTAREFSREVVLPVEQADLPEDADACLAVLVFGSVLPEHGRKRDVLHHREIEYQREILEDVPELVEPEHGLLVIGEGAYIGPVYHDPAGSGDIQQPQHMQKRGLAASACSHDPEKLSLCNIERHAIQRPHLDTPHPVDFRQILDLDHGIRPSLQSGYPRATPGRQGRSRQRWQRQRGSGSSWRCPWVSGTGLPTMQESRRGELPCTPQAAW